MTRRSLALGTAVLVVIAVACARRGPGAAAPASARATRSATIGDEVEAAERAWARAMRLRDSVSLERILAPDFVVESTAPGRPAERASRAVWLRNTLQRLRLDSVALRDIHVAARGARGDSATARLWLWWAPAGRGIDNLLEDTWVRQPGGWQVVRRVILESRLRP